MSEESKAALEVVQINEESKIESMIAKYSNVLSPREKQYYDIDVTDAMTKLAHCGSLLQLAYASSDGFKCQGDIVVLLSKYGTLVKDSYITSSKFVNASFQSLLFHKLALKLASKKPQKAVLFVSKCSKVAEIMAFEAGQLSDKAQDLANIAENALSVAINDKTVSKQIRADIQQRIATAKKQSEELQKLTNKLNTDLEHAKAAESEAVKQAAKERSRQFALNMMKTIVAPITEIVTMTQNGVKAVANVVMKAVVKNDGNNDDEKKMEISNASLDDRACILTKNRIEIKNKLIEQNENLGKTLAELSGLQLSGDSLQMSLKALELAIKTLGKIKVIFSNTKKFWEGVKTNCLQIVNDNDIVQELTDDGLEEELEEAIVASALNWFVLCKVNYFAKKAISAVDKGVDAILNDLPNETEALKLVPVLSQEMKQMLAQEKKAIQDSE